jgi:hypothetical protein
MVNVPSYHESRSNSTITVPRLNNTDYMHQDFSSKQRAYSHSHQSTEIDSNKMQGQPTPPNVYKRDHSSTPQMPTPGRFYQNSNGSSHSPII